MPISGITVEVSMGFALSFFIIIKLNDNFFGKFYCRIKYNIGVLTINIEFMWLGTKRLKLKLVFPSVSKPRHINSIFTVNTPILYIYLSVKRLHQVEINK